MNEHPDVEETKQRIEQLGGQCLIIQADLRLKSNCASVVSQTINSFGKLDILINHIGVQFPQNSILDITEEQLLHTYQTNIFSFFFMTQSALPHLRAGSSIINTASITAYVYLASDDSRFVTGETMHINGGAFITS